MEGELTGIEIKPREVRMICRACGGDQYFRPTLKQRVRGKLGGVKRGIKKTMGR